MSSALEEKIKRVILEYQLSDKNIAGLSVSQDAKIILALSIKHATEAKKLEPLRASLQEALGKLDGASSAQVIFTADKPQPRAIIAVASGKGGVGSVLRWGGLPSIQSAAVVFKYSTGPDAFCRSAPCARCSLPRDEKLSRTGCAPTGVSRCCGRG